MSEHRLYPVIETTAEPIQDGIKVTMTMAWPQRQLEQIAGDLARAMVAGHVVFVVSDQPHPDAASMTDGISE